MNWSIPRNPSIEFRYIASLGKLSIFVELSNCSVDLILAIWAYAFEVQGRINSFEVFRRQDTALF
jgi:hypothetical protein